METKSKANQMINNNIKELFNVTEEDYKKWCSKNNYNAYDKSKRGLFMKELLNGNIK